MIGIKSCELDIVLVDAYGSLPHYAHSTDTKYLNKSLPSSLSFKESNNIQLPDRNIRTIVLGSIKYY